MKFIIEKSIFIKLLSNVCNVASKKNSDNPLILQNIKIEAKNGTLYLTGTDADTYIKNNTKINIEAEGVTTISAQLIYDIVKKMEDGSEITCQYVKDDNVFLVMSGKSKFKLMCLDAETYPNFEEQDMPIEFKILTQNFINIIDKTRFSISDDPGRYYLNGLFIQTVNEEDGLKFCGVSTDGHRLSVIKVNGFNGKESVSGVIIPKKALPEIKKVLCSTNEEEVTIYLSKTKIKVETNDTIIISKLIDAEFPDYNRVIPTENNKILKVNKKAITSIIDRVSTVVSDSSHRGIKFLLNKNNLLLESSSTENGFASEDMIVDFTSDESIEIGFNYKFILDIFSQIESDNVVMYFKDNSSAILIKGEEENNNIFVLMPVRI